MRLCARCNRKITDMDLLAGKVELRFRIHPKHTESVSVQQQLALEQNGLELYYVTHILGDCTVNDRWLSLKHYLTQTKAEF